MLDWLDHYCRAYAPYKGGAWCYEDGCLYRGLDLLHEATGDGRWHGHLLRLITPQVGPQGELAGYDPDTFNIDNILPGRSLIALARQTGDARYLAAARRLVAQLDRHPRIPAGNYWHKARYPRQVWLDGLYMALPFQVEYGLLAGEGARVTDALAQLSSALALTPAPGGLFVHGYDDARAQAWADPVTGRSPAVWARAMGWLAMALVDSLVALPAEAAPDLRRQTAGVLAALADRQGASGLWPQVLDAPDLAGNYDESSASAMFAYAFLRAERAGMSSGLRPAALRALAALETRIAPGEGLTGICHVAGLGAWSGAYRDGSPAYYLTEAVVANDAKGVGPLMMACAEAARGP